MHKYCKIPNILHILALLAVITMAPAKADLISFSATLDGAQANAGAGSGSLATGSATMWLDDMTNNFSWNIGWSGLDEVVAAHFHGPAAPDANAGVEVAIDFTMNPTMGNAILNDQQVGDLLAGLWYINIHTADFPGGEIRGQVVPEPDVLSLLLVPLIGLIYVRRRRR
ncbi:CHRD domain-containing protein [Paraglaciecola polaris]|nr:CHRD domain-containing protein [Paraglaciecola polaris]|tara:strand:- start:2331 stop:2837 length:507 start_codon:yes stop_codon:yes gene_type:complete